MSGQFKVGEVLIGQNFCIDVRFNGAECTVIGPLMIRTAVHSLTGQIMTQMAYQVDFSMGDGILHNVGPRRLRRKQPPSGEHRVMDWFKLPAPSKTREVA